MVAAIAVLTPLGARAAAAASSVEVVGLTTDYRVNPLADDAAQPRFGWQLRSPAQGDRQTAYQVQVSTASPIWDSGPVSSADQVGVAYGGPPLMPATRYRWQVRVWDAAGQPSRWSQPAWWETGLGVGPNSWSGAQWIGVTQPSDAPLLRKEFVLAKPVASARAYVFGLGWYELHLNGRKVDDRVLTPANTQYQHTLLYDSYDVGDYLHAGANAVGAWLGNGYGPTYSQYGWRWLGPKQVTVKLSIQLTDGSTTTVVTGPGWRWSDGPIVANDIYQGETFDARLSKAGWDSPGYHDAGWHPAVSVAAPRGVLTAATGPPVRVARTIRPVARRQPKPGVYVFDLGVNIAGWVRLSVAGAAGTRVQLRHSEDLGPDGMIDPTTNRNAAATDVYILGADPSRQVYEPRFTYHGFRYVELTGFPGTPDLDSIAGQSIHADVASTGSFASSDHVLDQIHANASQTILNNTMSIPTDNPVRDERTPVAMDVQAYAEAAAGNFDMLAFYRTYLDDLVGSGFFTPGASPDMNATPVLLTWLLYSVYGDRATLERIFPYLTAYVDSLASKAPDGIWPDGNGFGDWCPPPAAGDPGGYASCLSERPLVNTALYYRAADLIARMAAVVGRPGDVADDQARAGRIAAAFNARFATAGGYGDGRQVTSILPLSFGLVPAEQVAAVRAGLLRTVTATNHLHTGIFGTRYLLDALDAARHPDVALAVLDQTTYPGFGYQIGLGATTMWEEWPRQTTMETHDHAMFAGIDASLYTDLAGITPLEPGYRRIRIRPPPPTAALLRVDATLNTVRGTVSCRWTSDHLIVQIPVNATAEVEFPLAGQPASSVRPPPGAVLTGADANYAAYAVGSGAYTFTRGRTASGGFPMWVLVTGLVLLVLLLALLLLRYLR